MGTRDLYHLLQELEARARQLDQLTAQVTGVEASAEVSAKRRFLLLDLQAEGFFDAETGDLEKSLAPFPLLYGYVQAARKLRAYYASDVRREYLNTPAPESLIQGPVSLDWFRFAHPLPQGFSENEWLANCEYNFHNIELGNGGGEIFFRTGSHWCVLPWRFEDGVHPAIYKATVNKDLR